MCLKLSVGTTRNKKATNEGEFEDFDFEISSGFSPTSADMDALDYSEFEYYIRNAQRSSRENGAKQLYVKLSPWNLEALIIHSLNCLKLLEQEKSDQAALMFFVSLGWLGSYCDQRDQYYIEFASRECIGQIQDHFFLFTGVEQYLVASKNAWRILECIGPHLTVEPFFPLDGAIQVLKSTQLTDQIIADLSLTAKFCVRNWLE